MRIEFLEIEDNKDINGSVIIAKQNGNYVMVKHKERNTWECPGGHLELDEKPLEAAKRELFEETGALKYTIEEICDYIIADSKIIKKNRLYFANIESFSNELFHEIEEVRLFESLPKDLTYSSIHPVLVQEVEKRVVKGN